MRIENLKSLSILLISLVLLNSACKNPRINEKAEWGKVYQELNIDSAAFEVCEQSKERVYYFNKAKGNQLAIPGSAFHVLLGLIAIEQDVLVNEDERIVPDAQSTWKDSITLRKAMSDNRIDVFATLARKIGKPELQFWIDTLRYGNKLIGNSVDSCWYNNTLRATPDEQVGFLKKMYFGELPFSSRSQKIIQSILLQEDKMKYRLYYVKSVHNNNGLQSGLQVGFLEDSTAHPYFFANAIDFKANTTNADSLLKLSTKKIFNTMNLME
jgi:beta-lactamase class D